MNAMEPRPGSRKIFIILTVVGIVILGGVGIFIAIMISQAKQVTPEETNAATCCSCNWRCTGVDCPPGSGPFESGTVDGEDCVLENPLELDGTTLTRCNIVENEGRLWLVNVFPMACEGGCMESLTDPVTMPTPAAGEVTFIETFRLKYAVEPNTKFTEAELDFTYPEGMTSPAPIHATFLSEGENSNEVTTDNENVTATVETVTDPNSHLPIKTYTVRFATTWELVTNSGTPGTYSVKPKVRDEAGEWIESSQCLHTYTVAEEIPTQQGCTSLDIRPETGNGTITPTVTATTNLGENLPIIYNWEMDLNCDGQIDSGPNSPEVFTTIGNPTVSNRSFTYPTGETLPITCAINVRTGTTDEAYPLACNESVTLRTTQATCGNGTCNTGETCDPSDDNNPTSCRGEELPAGGCRADCTYCGDGILDSNDGEQCDTGIRSGQPGYNEHCTDTCTIPSEAAGGMTVTATSSETCLERISPNNDTTITLVIANTSSEATLVRAVSDTLPQGFTYTAGSSVINGIANTGDTGVILETSGNSQLITWNNGGSGWTVPATSGTLTIQFTVTAGGNAITGTETNTISVTRADADPIAGQNSLLVAQTCTQPETGIFDNSFIILGGIAFLIIAGAAYYTGFGANKFAEVSDTIGSKANEVRGKASSLKDDIILRISQPQKFMERKIERTALKKINSRLNDERKHKGRK